MAFGDKRVFEAVYRSSLQPDKFLEKKQRIKCDCSRGRAATADS